MSSVWCLREGKRAFEHNRQIALAKIYPESNTPLETILTSEYTYGDFTEDFEVGFRRITTMMMGYSVSSWEYASNVSDDNELLQMLGHGQIPSLITRSLLQWIIVEKLWKNIEQYRALDNPLILHGDPCTSEGLVRQCDSLLEQFEYTNDTPGFVVVKEASKILKPFIRKMKRASSEDHLAMGQIASKFGKDIYQYLLLLAEIKGSVSEFQRIEGFYTFDLAEKLRELVFIHANRSRYLY